MNSVIQRWESGGTEGHSVKKRGRIEKGKLF